MIERITADPTVITARSQLSVDNVREAPELVPDALARDVEDVAEGLGVALDPDAAPLVGVATAAGGEMLVPEMWKPLPMVLVVTQDEEDGAG